MVVCEFVSRKKPNVPFEVSDVDFFCSNDDVFDFEFSVISCVGK